MLRLTTYASLLLTAAAPAFCQSTEPASFDVASVKVDTSGQNPLRQGKYNIGSTPASVTMINVPLKAIIAWAYHVFPYQVIGPGWMETERYDIAAKSAGAVNEFKLREMLQNLLASRFKIALHRETREMAAYVVTVSKEGIKFKESVTEGELEMKPAGNMVMELKHVTMIEMAELIGNMPIPDPVIDQTGLKGRYDLVLDASKFAASMTERPSGIDEMISILARVIQDQLGLKVDHRKAPVDLILIDHAEKVPVEN